MSHTFRHVAAYWLAALLCLACSGAPAPPDPSRCAHCGMRVEDASPWRAGATRRDGAPVGFDTPKCLHRWLSRPDGAGARDAWITEYYSGERASADSVLYVLDSDVVGPMGRDLVPVATRDRAESFARDHGGRVVERPSAEVVEALFTP